MKSRLSVLFTLVIAASLMLSACNSVPLVSPAATPTVAPADSTSAAYEEADCPFDIPSGEEVDCGYLTVPEDRSNPDSRTIRLAVAIVRSPAKNPEPDPIVYLEGGPGGSPLKSYAEDYYLLFDPFIEDRDLILIDQRGTGFSEPNLSCPEENQLTLDLLDKVLTDEEETALETEALTTCRDRLVKEGVNLSAYNSAENAADLNDLRLALGYKEWNLYGISYGTRLALTAMRDFPEGIRSVVIDSVYPPQASLITEGPTNAANSLRLVFETCKNDTDCNKAYPDLEQVYNDTIAELNETPVTIQVTRPDGTVGDAKLDGRGLTGFVVQVMYMTSAIPAVPQMIYEAYNQQFSTIAALESMLLQSYDDVSTGMYYSVECSEEVPFSKIEDLETALEENPEVSGAFGSADNFFKACELWDTEATDAVENTAVSSDIPTLVIAGSFDPVTPPSWAQEVAKTLRNSTYVEVPYAGHGSSLSESCPQQIVLKFIANTTRNVNTSCLKKVEKDFSFFTPFDKADVTLKEYNSRLMGFSTVIPAGWTEVMTGFFTPSGSETDTTQLMVQGGPVKPEIFLSTIEASLKDSGIILDTENTTAYSSANLDWTIYNVDGGLITISMALGQVGNNTYIVLLQTPSHLAQSYYDELFIPILDSLQPN